MREGRAVAHVILRNVHLGLVAVDGHDAASGFVIELPPIPFAGRKVFGVDALARNDEPNDARTGAPATGAILEMTMERLAASVDARSKGIRRAPLVESVGV